MHLTPDELEKHFKQDDHNCHVSDYTGSNGIWIDGDIMVVRVMRREMHYLIESCPLCGKQYDNEFTPLTYSNNPHDYVRNTVRLEKYDIGEIE